MEPGRRSAVLGSIRRGASTFGVKTFASSVSPTRLGEDSWAEVILNRDQYKRRQALRRSMSPLSIDPVQGVLSSANRMRADYHEYLTTGALSAIGGGKSKHGIFLLTDEEYRALGRLGDAEEEVLKVFVNTQDVLPYAAVVGRSPMRLIYLPAPASGGGSAPFPARMPSLQRHLLLFRPLLEAKTERYGEDRPWWSLHRPRSQIVSRDSHDDRWADYAITPNWGGGGRLVVGLAPAGSIPAQGLNALLTPSDVPGAYASGVLNSTAIQELADTLPPGYLRRADFLELGAPLVPDIVQLVAETAIRTADVVGQMADLATRFPLLLSSLRADIALASVPFDVWVPSPGPAAKTGTIQSVRLLELADRRSVGSQRVSQVDVTRDLLGLRVSAYGPERQDAFFSLALADDEEGLAEALAAYLRGAGASGARLRDIPALPVTTQPNELEPAYSADKTTLAELAQRYRSLRAIIDDALAPYL
jgi:hypothetical protein